MRKWHEWAFIALLVALAVTGGWMSQHRGLNIADANIETDQG